MKWDHNPFSSLTTQETGLPKSYSKREFVASFKADPELWSRFKGECAARGVSICHVLEALMEAWIQGQKAEATLIRPVVINLKMEHIVERPRRALPFGELEDIESVEPYISKYGACYRLVPKGFYPGRIGYCRWAGRWIQGLECATCIHSGDRH